MCQRYAYVKEQRLFCPDTNSGWKYKFDIKAIGQGHTEVMNVWDTLSHNDALMCQILYDYFKRQKSCGPNTKTYDKNPINLVTDQDRIGILYDLMMIHPCVKYDMPISKQTEVTGQTWRHIKNLINSSFRSKVKSYVDHECTWHIVLWWYTHVQNMICQCWSKKELRAIHKSSQWEWTDVRTVWFLYTPLNINHRGY